jgi:uncharacterized protein (DUF1697 family)
MANRRETYIALLRGINVSGKNRIPMAKLRSICAETGCERVNTYIQSGNVVFRSSMSAEALEERFENAIAQEFDITIPVIVRKASTWQRYLKTNPFPDEANKEANWVLLCLSKRPPRPTAASDLQQRATHGERVTMTGDAIWIHYANGIARSKLTPAVLDRLAGSSVTARNWRTVLKIGDMLRETTLA